MDTFAVDWDLEQTTGTSGHRPEKPLIVVVGYDGSEPAEHALDEAVKLLRHREGELEVVFVAHMPASAAMSADAIVQIQQGFDHQSVALADEVRTRLEGLVSHWHFQRRDGAIAAQLEAVASDFDDRFQSNVDLVIVAGGSAHRYHRLAGSVGAALAHHDRFPVIVVP